MAQTLFRVGQRVQVLRGGAVGGPSGFCAIVAPLPRESGPQQYRVRTDGESFDRIVDETRLAAVTYD
jgi:hypothetical protein